MSYTFNQETGLYTVSIEYFQDLLQELDENTVETAYKINVTGLKASNCAGRNYSYDTDFTIQRILGNNSNKYVFFQETAESFTENIPSMSYCFKGCHNMCGINFIPEGVSDMSYCFYNCVNFNSPIEMPNSVINATLCFYCCSLFNSLLKLSDNLVNMNSMLSGCLSFNQKLTIPSKVTDMSYAFSTCISLKQDMEIPNGVTNMYRAFYECMGMNGCKVFIPSSVENIKELFSYYPNRDPNPYYSGGLIYLYLDYSGEKSLDFTKVIRGGKIYSRNSTRELLKQNIKLYDTLLADKVVDIDYSEDMEIPFDKLDFTLDSMAPNTIENPYKINITGLNNDNLKGVSINLHPEELKEGTVQYELLKYNGNDYPVRYVYLNENENSYEGTISDMSYSFDNCTDLVGFGTFPNGIKKIEGCFNNCTEFNSDVTLPEDVSSLESLFAGCSKLNQNITIPERVSNMSCTFLDNEAMNQNLLISKNVMNLANTFEGCSSLEEVTLGFDYDENRVMDNAFKDCSNLNAIHISGDATESFWKYFSINTGSKTYNIYKSGDSTPIASGTYTKESDSFEIPIVTDELVMFREALDEDVVKKHVNTHLPFAKNALSPDKKNFVLWSDNPSGFRTNLQVSSTYPEGFVYTQYSGTKNPGQLGLNVPEGCYWADITGNYKGEFFRAYKDKVSEDFSETSIIEQSYQTDNIPHSHYISVSGGNHSHKLDRKLSASGTASNNAYAGNSGSGSKVDPYTENSGSHSHTGYTNIKIYDKKEDGRSELARQETRPVNSAIKIWQVKSITE